MPRSTKPLRDVRAVFRGHETEGEREKIGVQRGVIGAFAIAIQALRGIEEIFLKRGAGGGFTRGVIGGIRILMQGAGEFGHVAEGAQVKGVHHGVHRLENKAIPLAAAASPPGRGD